MKAKCEQWYPTKAGAIAASNALASGRASPHDHPPDVSDDCFTDNRIDYLHWAAWVRDGHGWVYVAATTIGRGG